MRICFSVLHYQRVDVTARCVDSILELERPAGVEVLVVVIDNCSPNKSFANLEALYEGNDSVQVLLNSENAGFARGNNFGFSYIKENCPCDIAVFLNNDTEIIQADFLKVLLDEHEAGFDVLGIDVYDPSVEQHQAPLCSGDQLETYAVNEARLVGRHLDKTAVQRIVANGKVALSQVFYPIRAFEKAVTKRMTSYEKSKEWWNVELPDAVVHGSCVIYSSNYMDQMDWAFYPETFMYFEECILKVLCDAKGLSSRYTPAMQILHHHFEYSRGMLSKNSVKALQSRAKAELASYEVLKRVYKESTGRELEA